VIYVTPQHWIGRNLGGIVGKLTRLRHDQLVLRPSAKGGEKCLQGIDQYIWGELPAQARALKRLLAVMRGGNAINANLGEQYSISSMIRVEFL